MSEREKLLLRLREINAELAEIRIDFSRLRQRALSGEIQAAHEFNVLREVRTRFAFERDEILRQLAGG
jgi:hypothetical protein